MEIQFFTSQYFVIYSYEGKIFDAFATLFILFLGFKKCWTSPIILWLTVGRLKINLNERRRKLSWSILKWYLNICLAGLRKTRKQSIRRRLWSLPTQHVNDLAATFRGQCHIIFNSRKINLIPWGQHCSFIAQYTSIVIMYLWLLQALGYQNHLHPTF